MTPSAAAAAAVAAVLAAGPPARPPVLDPKDFAEYWSAARAHLAGANPYDPAVLLPLQRRVYGRPDLAVPVMLWTPPWTLPLYWPFAGGSVRHAHLAWLAAQVAAAGLAVRLTWRAVGGPTGGWWVARLGLVALFAPVWWMVGYGQGTGVVAVGAAGYIWGRATGRPVAAGLFAALTAVKPHLLAPFGLVLVLDGLFGTGRKPLAVGVAAVAGLGAVAAVPRPQVYADFAATLAGPPVAGRTPVAYYALPTLGYRLRTAAAGADRLAADRQPGALFWVQFVPCLAGGAAAAGYWWRRRAGWDWAAEGPRLVLASALVTPYGGWIFDLTVLLVPVAAAAAGLARGGRPVPAAVFAAVLPLTLAATFQPALVTTLGDTVWFTPAVLAAYVVAVTGTARPPVSPAERGA